MNIHSLLAVTFSLLAMVAADLAYAEDCAGVVKAEWLEDGRKMKLLADYVYRDPLDRVWLAPTDTIVDGASIPRFAWTLIGGPYEGKYRKASVAHDAACKFKVKPWQDVHRMFYTHMLCSGVSKGKAQAMYWAVYQCGPRWGGDTPTWCASPAVQNQFKFLAAGLAEDPVDDIARLERVPTLNGNTLDLQGLPQSDRILDMRESASNRPDFLISPSRNMKK